MIPRGRGGKNTRAFSPRRSFLSFPVDFMMASAIKVNLGRAFGKKEQQQLLAGDDFTELYLPQFSTNHVKLGILTTLGSIYRKHTLFTQKSTFLGNRSFRYKVVSIQLVSIRTQAVKLPDEVVHFTYSLRVNKKNVLGEYFFLFKPRTSNYLRCD